MRTCRDVKRALALAVVTWLLGIAPAAAAPNVSESSVVWPTSPAATNVQVTTLGSNGSTGGVSWTRYSPSTIAPWLVGGQSFSFWAPLESPGAARLVAASDPFRQEVVAPPQLLQLAVNSNGTGLGLRNGELVRIARGATQEVPLPVQVGAFSNYEHGSSGSRVVSVRAGADRFFLALCDSVRCEALVLDDAGNEIMPRSEVFAWTSGSGVGTFGGNDLNLGTAFHAGRFSFVASFRRQMRAAVLTADTSFKVTELETAATMNPPCTDTWNGISNMVYGQRDAAHRDPMAQRVSIWTTSRRAWRLPVATNVPLVHADRRSRPAHRHVALGRTRHRASHALLERGLPSRRQPNRLRAVDGRAGAPFGDTPTDARHSLPTGHRQHHPRARVR